jgi:ribose/xylose/arabinose/galactoside ABC-type transport system permease subunit
MTNNNTLKARLRPVELLGRIGPVIGLLFVIALFGFLRPRTFLSADNFQIMLLQTAVVGTAALGMTLIIISGGIDLSIGSNIALCTVAVALLLKQGFPPALAALGGIAVGSLCGLLIGLLITRLRLTPFIVTLGMWGALRGAAKGLANQTMVAPPPPGSTTSCKVSALATIGSSSRPASGSSSCSPS